MVLLPTVFLGVLLIRISTASFKNCEDCMMIGQCKEALVRVRVDKSDATANILRRAHCGSFNNQHKVCCSEFKMTARSNFDKNDNEIENHPNIDLLSNKCGDIEGNKIVGGTTAALYEFPWLVIVMHRTSAGDMIMNCGGSLINSRYVLTAAHCIQDLDVAKVRIGEYDIGRNPDCTGHGKHIECESYYQEINVSEQIYHEYFNRHPVYINDIGLLRLNETVNLAPKNAGVICLPVTKALLEMEIYGERGTVAGWGLTERDVRSEVLLKVDVPLFSPRRCSNLYYRGQRAASEAYNRLRNTFCAGEVGHDSCKGDSGGPIMLDAPVQGTYKLVQIGVVSFGNMECGSRYPGVNTDIRKYMKWILDNIRP